MRTRGAGLMAPRNLPSPQMGLDLAPVAGSVQFLCGVDEAGRGPLAGPVYAAAVVFDPAKPMIRGLADSKILSAIKREAPLRQDLRARARLAYRVRDGARDRYAEHPPCLDARDATRGAGAGRKGITPDLVQVDGNRCPQVPFPVEAIVKAIRWSRRFRRRPSWPRWRATAIC
ncbi:hypothetical protein ACTMU2_13090 [Cupriavidus basilensis]